LLAEILVESVLRITMAKYVGSGTNLSFGKRLGDSCVTAAKSTARFLHKSSQVARTLQTLYTDVQTDFITFRNSLPQCCPLPRSFLHPPCRHPCSQTNILGARFRYRPQPRHGVGTREDRRDPSAIFSSLPAASCLSQILIQCR
jgi:hypothetical protein